MCARWWFNHDGYMIAHMQILIKDFVSGGCTGCMVLRAKTVKNEKINKQYIYILYIYN